MLTNAVFISPFLRRFAWYARHVAGSVDRRTIAVGLSLIVVMVLLATALITIFEKAFTADSIAQSFNWALLAIIGRAPTTYVTSVGGWAVYWVMALFGVLVVATVTASIVGAVVNSLIQEGRGMGTSGFRDHIVVCGWNATARDLIGELQRDNRKLRIALIYNGDDKNPAGDGVYFVKGDPTDPADLERAGIREAAAALLFPLAETPDADMRSILTALTIRSLAPGVRVVVEVNDPKHADHIRRAGADELMITSHIASRLLARSAIYPGLADIIADLVSAGGAELHRVNLPADFIGLDFEEAGFRLRQQHHATLLAVRRGERVIFGGQADLTLQATDDVIVIAEQLGRLEPAELRPTEGGRATDLVPDGPGGVSDAPLAASAMATERS
jgi:voltage-gated potassium channel